MQYIMTIFYKDIVAYFRAYIKFPRKLEMTAKVHPGVYLSVKKR